MTHHTIDVYPVPKEKSPLYINEPWLIDKSQSEFINLDKKPEAEPDNIRVYVPLDLNKSAILRRLYRIISHYEEANEANESEFLSDVNMLISQIEIYDQVWAVKHIPENSKHSQEAIELVESFIEMLEEIPDGCAECFPFETIDLLREEYLQVSKSSKNSINAC